MFQKKKNVLEILKCPIVKIILAGIQCQHAETFDVLHVIRFFFLRLTKDQVSYAVNDRHLRTLMLNGTSLKD